MPWSRSSVGPPVQGPVQSLPLVLVRRGHLSAVHPTKQVSAASEARSRAVGRSSACSNRSHSNAGSVAKTEPDQQYGGAAGTLVPVRAEALGEIASIDAMGGAVRVIETGVLKAHLVESNTRRLEAIERGEQIVVGVNAFVNSEPSPLTAGEGSIMVPSAEAEAEQIATLKAWRAGRDHARVREALRGLRSAAASGANIMRASIEAAKAGVTTGEWGDALRAEFGEFRASNRRFAEGATGGG